MSEHTEGLGNVRKLRRDALKAAPAAGGAPGGGADSATATVLPDHCPVRPIGLAGDEYYYLDQLGQMRALKARDHSRLPLMSLFGRKSAFLYDTWPRRTQLKETGEWVTTGWKPEEAAQSLMAACAGLGVWSAEERVRGGGAWAGRDGELVLHCGDTLLMVPRQAGPDGAAPGGNVWSVREPGMLDGIVYPTGAPALKPHDAVQSAGPAGPGGELLRLLETWRWRRPTIDAHLMVGWIAAAMLGGALDWRPVAWITGGHGTGKTTLASIVKWIMGAHGLIHTSDATAAGIRQVTRFASRPVALDESEAEEDGRKMQGLIKLARDAGSGSISLRGGQDHNAAAFTVRSAFLFSSILIPPLLPQDRSRIAVLELDRIEAHGSERVLGLTQRRMEELGTRLLRRLVQQWPRFGATLDAYRGAMAAAGHSARGQDLFGTLLACADVLLSDAVPDEDVLSGWAGKLAAANLAETSADVTDENACLGYLLTTQIDSMRDRQRQTVGRWIKAAVGNADRYPDGQEQDHRDAANRVLLDHGLKVVRRDHKPWLAVANYHRGLAKLFENTQWAGRPGATGVWVQALRRLPHLAPIEPMWMGATTRVTLLLAGLCLLDETPDAMPAAPDLYGAGMNTQGE